MYDSIVKFWIFPAVLIAVALVRFFFFMPSIPEVMTNAVGQIVIFDGKVASNPDIRSDGRVMFDVQPKGSDILIRTFLNTESLEHGDTLRLRGTLEYPESFTTDNGTLFDYESYLFSRGVYLTLEHPSVVSIEKPEKFIFMRSLYRVQGFLTRTLHDVLPARTRGLAEGMLFGGSRTLSKEDTDAFIKTGTIHIVALSGYNITIIIETVRILLLRFLSLVGASLGSAFVAIVFVAMTGFQATAMRALLMSLFILGAYLVGRPQHALRAVIMAGLILLAYDPRMLFDISFQLSMLATLGIILVPPRISRFLSRVPNFLGIRESMGVTFGATIATLPLILYRMGMVSLVSIPFNLFIAPLVPVSMFFSFTALVLSLISPMVGMLAGYIAHVPLYLITKIVIFGSNIPFANVSFPDVSVIIPIIMYGLLAWWVMRNNENKK